MGRSALPSPSVVAGVDCGTNSTRLIVVDGAGAVLERQMHVTRLGQGVDATGRLSAEAIERTLAVLRRFRARMDELGVTRMRAVATSAARDAANGADFFVPAEAVLGVRPELLSGDEEGMLSFAGATAHLPAGLLDQGPLLTVDIGGGSTELATGIPGEKVSVGAVSLDIGCVRVTERFLADDPPTPAQLGEAKSHVVHELERARRAIGDGLAPGGPVIGLAGTVSTLAALEHEVAEYSREALHHVVLRRDDVVRWRAVLAGESTADRLRRPGMLEGRADVIVGGALVLEYVMAVFDRGWCLVSEDDILDGLAASIAG